MSTMMIVLRNDVFTIVKIYEISVFVKILSVTRPIELVLVLM